jgi:predicted nucleic acid-binding protein
VIVAQRTTQIEEADIANRIVWQLDNSQSIVVVVVVVVNEYMYVCRRRCLCERTAM